MPGFDGTGPRGLGPFTGGSRGFCALRFTRSSMDRVADGYVGLQGTPVFAALAPTDQDMTAMLPPVYPRFGIRGGWYGRGRGRARRW